MTTKIKNISVLPDWFYLENYSEAKKLTAIQWYEQLLIRHDCLKKEKFKEENKHTNELFKILRQNPIVDTNSNPMLFAYFWNRALPGIKTKNAHYSLAVHPLTIRELLLIDSEINQDKNLHMWKWQHQIQNGNFNEDYDINSYIKYEQWIDEPIYKSSENTKKSHAVWIDLSLPDSLLIENFERALRKIRGETNTHSYEERNRIPNFTKWCDLGVLPYLDLCIWEQQNNTKIPNRVMAEAIYSKSMDFGEETVRKTTAPLVESLITDEELNKLASYAALELEKL